MDPLLLRSPLVSIPAVVVLDGRLSVDGLRGDGDHRRDILPIDDVRTASPQTPREPCRSPYESRRSVLDQDDPVTGPQINPLTGSVRSDGNDVRRNTTPPHMRNVLRRHLGSRLEVVPIPDPRDENEENGGPKSVLIDDVTDL